MRSQDLLSCFSPSPGWVSDPSRPEQVSELGPECPAGPAGPACAGLDPGRRDRHSHLRRLDRRWMGRTGRRATRTLISGWRDGERVGADRPPEDGSRGERRRRWEGKRRLPMTRARRGGFCDVEWVNMAPRAVRSNGSSRDGQDVTEGASTRSGRRAIVWIHPQSRLDSALLNPTRPDQTQCDPSHSLSGPRLHIGDDDDPRRGLTRLCDVAEYRLGGKWLEHPVGLCVGCTVSAQHNHRHRARRNLRNSVMRDTHCKN